MSNREANSDFFNKSSEQGLRSPSNRSLLDINEDCEGEHNTAMKGYEKGLLIHIGYHKTATTWLQRHLLDNPEANFKRYMGKADIRDCLIMPNALDFDAQELRAYYDSLVNSQQGTDSETSVISSERLSGHPHSGGYDSKEIAKRLYESFPDGKVLIVIREQKSAIASCYLQYVKFGGPCSLRDYLEPPNRNQSILPLFSFEHFDYLPLIEFYYELFGKDKVLVLTYESFKEDPLEFCKAIANFAGANELENLPFRKITNTRISSFSSEIARQLNKLLVKTRLNPSAIGSGALEKLITKAFQGLDLILPGFIHKYFDKKNKKLIADKVVDRYGESNRKLSELTGLNLGAYGYDLEESANPSSIGEEGRKEEASQKVGALG